MVAIVAQLNTKACQIHWEWLAGSLNQISCVYFSPYIINKAGIFHLPAILDCVF